MSRRPYKSTGLKLLQGARVKQSEIESEPKPRPIEPEPMPGLTAAEKRTHKLLSRQLTRIGLTTEIDGQALSLIVKIQRDLVNIWKKVRMAERLARSAEKSGDPDAIIAADQHLQRWLRQERQFAETFRRVAAEVGLTPRGRTGLKINISEANNDENLLTKAP